MLPFSHRIPHLCEARQRISLQVDQFVKSFHNMLCVVCSFKIKILLPIAAVQFPMLSCGRKKRQGWIEACEKRMELQTLMNGQQSHHCEIFGRVKKTCYPIEFHSWHPLDSVAWKENEQVELFFCNKSLNLSAMNGISTRKRCNMSAQRESNSVNPRRFKAFIVLLERHQKLGSANASLFRIDCSRWIAWHDENR